MESNSLKRYAYGDKISLCLRHGVIAMNEKDKKKQKNNSIRKLTKQEKRDTWTVVAILASIMLIAVGISLFQSRVIDTETYSGMTNREKREAAEDARNIMIGAGAVCLIVVVVYAIKRANRRQINEKNFNKFFSEQERLETAKKRLEKARLDKIKNEAENIMSTGRNQQERIGDEPAGGYVRTGMSTLNDKELMDDEEKQAYLEKRRRQYRYYMENEGEDLPEEMLDELINSTESGGERWRIIAIVCGIVAIIAMGIIIFMLVIG